MRSLALAASAAFLCACGQESGPGPGADAPADRPIEGRAQIDLFADSAAPGDQIVFVGRDSAVRTGDRDRSVFVPLATFSVERDGIPNEFPPADSMAAMLEAAGVGAERLLIVGEPIPAGRTFAALDYLGLGDRAVLLDGGPGALAAAPGQRSDTAAAPGADSRPPADGGLDVDVRDDMIVDAAWVNERINDPAVAILDARPPAEFSGDTPGEGVNRPGHIPGARNVFWQTLVHSEADPRLRDDAELRRLFEEAGVGPDDTVVAYCRTGGQASFLYTVARHLGYDVRLYDGSYIDWDRTDYPVER